MVVDPIHLPRPRTTTVIKYERLQGLSELRIKLGERFGQRALTHTRRAGKNNQTPLSSIGHVRIPGSCAPLLFLGPCHYGGVAFKAFLGPLSTPLISSHLFVFSYALHSF